MGRHKMGNVPKGGVKDIEHRKHIQGIPPGRHPNRRVSALTPKIKYRIAVDSQMLAKNIKSECVD